MDAEILGELIIKKAGDSEWELQSPIEFRLANGRIAIAQKGFTLDFGSTGIFGGASPPLGSGADWGYCLHDLLYASHRAGDTTWTRKDADAAMREMHLFKGVSPILCEAIHAAVRAGGLSAWQTEEEREAWNMTNQHEFMDQ